MTQDNIVKSETPVTQKRFSDALSKLVQQGARQITAQAAEANGE